MNSSGRALPFRRPHTAKPAGVDWGRNTEGELGPGDAAPSQQRLISRVGSSADWVEVVSVDSPTDVGSGYTQLTAGRFHTCAIRLGEVVCTGDNGVGQLGTGTGRLNAPAPVLRPVAP